MGSEETEPNIFHSCYRVEELSLFGGWEVPSGKRFMHVTFVIIHLVHIDEGKENTIGIFLIKSKITKLLLSGISIKSICISVLISKFY